MAVNLSPIWGAGAQLLDNSGNVLSGGKIYTYAAGTTTPVTTFTSNTGITANSNPIVLNSAGRVPYEIWLTDGQNYKFVLKDSNDVLIGTWDNLSGINSNFIAYTNQQEIQTATAGQTVFNLTTMNYLPATNSLSVFVDGVNQYGPGASYAYEETDSNTVTFTSGLHDGAEVKFTSSQIQNAGVADASQITYDPPFTGAVATNVEAKLSETVSVKDFGAVGDGVTDDTQAVQDANSATSCVYVPDGEYKTTDTFDSVPQGFYEGSGNIETNDSSVDHKRGNKVIRLYSQPSPLSNGNSVINFYDNEFTSKENYDIVVTGADTAGQPTTGYAQYDQITPQFFGAYYSSGYNHSTTTAAGRTGWAISRYRLQQAGDGDAICINANAVISNTNPSHTGLYGTPAASLFNGNISTVVEKVYLNPYEVNCQDNGNDVHCVGIVTNFQRNNGTASLGQYWAGVRMQATGTVSPDAAYQVANTWKVGFDTTVAGSTVRAIAMKADQEIHFDAVALTSGGSATYAGSFGGTKITYENSSASLNLYRKGTLKLAIGLSDTISYNPIYTVGEVRSTRDNVDELGAASFRWSVVFAATGTINTSDANEKTDIRPLDQKEKTAALAIKAKIKTFKFKDAVEKKGNDARIHCGVLAQDVKEAFETQGLDAEHYGVFCSDTLADGSVRLGVRYDELFAFIIGAM